MTAPPAGRPARGGGPGGARRRRRGRRPGPTSEKLADGVFRINGAYNALAVEFADHVVLFEPGPQNEARAQAIIAETKKVIPNKPIRYGVISHHHFDHTGACRPRRRRHHDRDAGGQQGVPDERAVRAAHAGARRAGEVRQEAGGRRLHRRQARVPGRHADVRDARDQGPAARRWPGRRLPAEGEEFWSTPTCSTCRRPTKPVPNPPVVGTMVFADNIERLKLDVERILSVHTLNPDRLTSVADIRASLGRK